MMTQLALHGGIPVRSHLLPYGRQQIDAQDCESVLNVLRSDWLTTGPMVAAFEERFAGTVSATHAVAVSSGTAALHVAMAALGIAKGDEVIVPTMTFAASANGAVYQGAIPRFVDVNPETLLIEPSLIEAKITPRTKAIIAVDYAGQPCDYQTLRVIADKHKIALVADACHALGARYKGQSVGTLADVNTFSLHPVKHITSGEGGVITTDDAELAKRMRLFRNHGITTDHRQREKSGSWFYEMVELGYNYRLTDIQCALGMSQLEKLAGWIARRQAIAYTYDAAFTQLATITPLKREAELSHAYHLYVIQLNLAHLKADRATIYQALRAEGIGVNVHYIPVHWHPFYRTHFGTQIGDCPVAEAAYERLLSLPIFPNMSDEDVQDVIRAVAKVCAAYGV